MGRLYYRITTFVANLIFDKNPVNLLTYRHFCCIILTSVYHVCWYIINYINNVAYGNNQLKNNYLAEESLWQKQLNST